MKTLVLYHKDCPDGFGAAWAASLSLGRGTDVDYVPAQYGEDPPASAMAGEYDRIYILDFSYNRETLERLREKTKPLLVIDHHKTAAETLSNFDYCIFDMTKSGAVLAWEYFFLGRPVPLMLRYVQDRDLWQWKIQGSKEFSAALSIYPRDFSKWDDLNQAISTINGPSGFIDLGRAVLDAKNHYVELLAKNATHKVIGGFAVPTVNSPLFQSELGEKLCNAKSADGLWSYCFAGVYFIDGRTNEEVWSLRSRTAFDVSKIAEIYGGGGHPGAAGFRVKKGTFDD